MSHRVRFSDTVDTFEEEPSSKKVKLDFPSESNEIPSKEPEELPEENENQEDDVQAILSGQEPGISHNEEGIKITPFNLEEEMEEGHFDSQGNFIFNKDSNIRDNWMDNVDWMEVHRAKNIAEVWSDVEDDDEEEKGDGSIKKSPKDTSDTPTQRLGSTFEMYEALVNFMHEGESVLATIRRLGSGSKKKSKQITKTLRPWEKRKLEEKGKIPSDSGDDSVDMKAMLQVTELADALLQAGEFDVYQETRERIAFRIRNNKSKVTAFNEDDQLDILGSAIDNIDESSGNPDTNVKSTPGNSSNVSNSIETTMITWEVMEDPNKESDIKGPFTSEQMCTFMNEGKYSGSKALVRKIDPVSHSSLAFNSIHRIDFELFID